MGFIPQRGFPQVEQQNHPIGPGWPKGVEDNNNIHICLEIGLERNIDFILIQESWIAQGNIYIIFYTPYHTILLEFCGIKFRVIIFVKKGLIY